MTMEPRHCDVLVIGAGISGLSAAAGISANAKVIVAEQEDHPAYHSTGRSAAILVDSYGSPAVQSLTAISRRWFSSNTAGGQPLLKRRGLMGLTLKGQEGLAPISVDGAYPRQTLTPAEILDAVPILREDLLVSAWYEPEASDIDVHGAILRLLAGIRENGGTVCTGARVETARRINGLWHVQTRAGEIQAHTVVNAAGAWAGEVGRKFSALDIPVLPLLRSAVLLDLPKGISCESWPMVVDQAETLYFKPDAGRLMLSLADERLVEPFDAYADDLDIAIAVDRFEQACTILPQRVGPSWAGLRTIVADREPVVGFDPNAENVFWIAALGGFGVQTGPALGLLAARLIEGGHADSGHEDELVRSLSPTRFTPAA